MARYFVIALLVTVAVLLVVFEADALFVLFGGLLFAVFLETMPSCSYASGVHRAGSRSPRSC